MWAKMRTGYCSQRWVPVRSHGTFQNKSTETPLGWIKHSLKKCHSSAKSLLVVCVRCFKCQTFNLARWPLVDWWVFWSWSQNSLMSGYQITQNFHIVGLKEHEHSANLLLSPLLMWLISWCGSSRHSLSTRVPSLHDCRQDQEPIHTCDDRREYILYPFQLKITARCL